MAGGDSDVTQLRAQIDRLRAELRGETTAGQAGELAHYDQHQADSGTALADRQAVEGRLVELEERLRRIEAGHPEQPEPYIPPSDPDDVSTPLDEPAPREQLSHIPMGQDPVDVEADPQEADDQPYLDVPGEVYSAEHGPARVGRDDPDDERLEERYRPE